MKYYRENGKEFLVNGSAKVRVETVKDVPSPASDERAVKIMNVREVINTTPNNPIQEGNVLAISFPKSHFNAQQYQWMKGEECQVPLQIADGNRPQHQEPYIDPALL
jgi:hypothetical protein